MNTRPTLLKLDLAYEPSNDLVKNADSDSVGLELGLDSAFTISPG